MAGARWKGHWREHCKTLLDKAARELNIRKPSDWYNVTEKHLAAVGASELLLYHTSLAAALKFVSPEISISPRKERLMRTLEAAEERLEIRDPRDWYSVQTTDLRQLGLPSTVTRFELAELLEEKYPQYLWEKGYFLRGTSARQTKLSKALANLFPQHEAKTDNDDIQIEGLLGGLDFFYPSLNLAFKYMERSHYVNPVLPPTEIHQKDSLAIQTARDNGLTLILIPCWWDSRTESIAATVKLARPDLLQEVSFLQEDPIPQHCPKFLSKDIKSVEGIGKPAIASFLTKIKDEHTKWWLFEKYDGVRAFWTPQKKAFFGRQGRKIVVPSDIADAMPDSLFLDGEIWFGRGSYQQAFKLLQQTETPSAVDWTKFKFIVFDVPNHEGSYAERYNVIEDYLGPKLHQYIELAPKTVCNDAAHIQRLFQDIVHTGGEGIILRDPSGSYQPGKSRGYLKYKKFRDAEALVVASVDSNMWRCELPNGGRFIARMESNEDTKAGRPQIGDVVSFKHYGFLLSSRKPKLPTLYRVRTDVKWQDVVQSWKEQKTPPSLQRTPSIKKNKPSGYWYNAENRKRAFYKYAKEVGIDVNDTDNWHDVSRSEFVRAMGRNILAPFGGSLWKALEATFPEFKAGTYYGT